MKIRTFEAKSNSFVVSIIVFSCFSSINFESLADSSLPEGGVIIAGDGSFEINGKTLNIHQMTPKMITEWMAFNIGENSSVNFIQPDKNAISLNRVISENPSKILGNLSANGQVFLVNSNGVLFGGNSSVDAGGLLVSTLDIENEKFLQENYEFKNGEGSGSIVNFGDLTANHGSYIALISPNISNNGEIQAHQGNIALISGDKVDIDFGRDGLITYEVDSGLINSLVENKGTILSRGGTVIMSAKARDKLTDAIVNNRGVIKAKGFSSHNGRVYLHSEGGTTINSGNIDVSSEYGIGGSIRHTGKSVISESGSIYDASGDLGGGEIEIGGSWQNTDFNVIQSDYTTIESGTVVKANSIKSGNGGRIVIWSNINSMDGKTTVNGRLEAKAGTKGGNGGNIETSGRHIDLDDIEIDLTSTHGSNGTWLIDPTDIIIRDGITTTPGESDLPNYEGKTDTSYILSSDIEAQLNVGTNVIIQTGSSGSETGTIRVNGAISKTSGGDASITLKSHNNIFVYRAIDSTSGKLDIVLQSNIDDTTGGVVVRGSSTHIDTNGGDFTVTGGSNGTDGAEASSGSQSGFDYGNGATINTQGGNVLINANGQDLVGVNFSNGTINSGLEGGIHILSKGTGTPFLIKENASGPVRLIAGSGGLRIDVETSGGTLSKDALSLGNNLDSINGQHLLQAIDGNIVINSYTHGGDSIATTNNAFYSRADVKIETVSSGDIELNLHSETGAGLKFDDKLEIASAGNLNINAKSDFDHAIQSVDLRNDGFNDSLFKSNTGNVSISAETLDSHGIYFKNGNVNFQSGSGNISVLANNLDTTDSNTNYSGSGELTISTNHVNRKIFVGNSGDGLILSSNFFDNEMLDGFSSINVGVLEHAGGLHILEDLHLDSALKLSQGSGGIAIDSRVSTALSKGLTIENNSITTQGELGYITSGSLLLIGTGTHILNNHSNDVDVFAANTGAINYIDSNGLDINTVDGVDGIVSTGDISIKTISSNKEDDLLISKSIITTSDSDNALLLNSGVNETAGDSQLLPDRADIIFNEGQIIVGDGGRALLLTGSIYGSRSLASEIIPGNFRYGSDETITNYTSQLGSGVYQIYRERPELSVSIKDTTSNFNGIGFESVQFDTIGYINNDGSISPSELIFGGTGIGAIEPGTYTLEALASSLGYRVSSNEATLEILPSEEIAVPDNESPTFIPELLEPNLEPSLELSFENEQDTEALISFNSVDSGETAVNSEEDTSISGNTAVVDSFQWSIEELKPSDSDIIKTIKGFEPGLDKIDISNVFEEMGVSTVSEIFNNININSSGGNVEIEMSIDPELGNSKIVIEGLTIDELIGVDTSTYSQEEIIELLMFSGELVVLNENSTQLGSSLDDVMVASDKGQTLFSGKGNDTQLGSVGPDILVGGKGRDTLTGGKGNDIFSWSSFDHSEDIVTTDTVKDFNINDDEIHLYDLIEDEYLTASDSTVLKDYIEPMFTSDGLELHIYESSGIKVQVINLERVSPSTLGVEATDNSDVILGALLEFNAIILK
ncbi:hypothetical protein RN22_08095 [Grimontia sp. AD028]|uniref:two-partner secretion domain-containing protein n=1 Tax=Grimontia sp. AD028 TaxID=1581149 RepID=UPI00061B32D3|nr:filamentous hemagglutinin N-terminal domain-containing protein [Grimontia sp. AD028]KKD60995.1 hypothetical protein RN22_08095 [Grimontia sp. AD028]